MHKDPDHSACYVTLQTNGDIVGNGITFTLGRGNEIVLKAIETYKPFVIGKRLSEITHDFCGFYRSITQESQLRWLGPEKGVTHLASAAILNAVWDLWAKSENKPIWQLLVDLTPEQVISVIDFTYIDDALSKQEAIEILRQSLPEKATRIETIRKSGYPAYTTSVGWLGYSDSTLRRLCKEALADGFQFFKMKVGHNVDDDIRRATIIREEIKDNLLAMDANQRWSVNEAISYMQNLKQFSPYWIEEPTSPDDILGHSTIAKALPWVRVATGEHAHNRVMFKQLLQADAIRVCQPDSCRLGSINELLAVILLAKKFKVPVCLHAGGVGLCEYVQHLALFDYIYVNGTVEDRYLEFVDHHHEHFVNPVVMQKGRYMVPTAPGYSIDMKEKSLTEYEFPHGKVWLEIAAKLSNI